MTTISRHTDVPANTITENVIAGSSFEYLESNSIVTLTALVITPQGYMDLQGLWQLGGTTLMQPPFAEIYSVIDNRDDTSFPNDIHHRLSRAFAPAGARLFLSLQNESTQAATVRWQVRIEGVA